MSNAVAVLFGIASAVVYGASIVVQHRTAQATADGSGEASAAGLLRLVKHPVFLLALAGDFVGFLLQIVALSVGQVVVIQPLVVLMLPVSLGVAFLLGGHRPTKRDFFGVVAVLGGLGAFLALIGQPGGGHVPRPRVILMAVTMVLLLGGIIALIGTRRSRNVKGAVYGGVAGAFFGSLAVMVDAASDRASQRGLEGLLLSPRGFIPLISMLLLGVGGMILTQMSFQVGALGATLPANLAVDPLFGVLLGTLLLREHVPVSPGHLAAYLLCLAAVLAGAVVLANPREPAAVASTPTETGVERATLEPRGVAE